MNAPTGGLSVQLVAVIRFIAYETLGQTLSKARRQDIFYESDFMR